MEAGSSEPTVTLSLGKIVFYLLLAAAWGASYGSMKYDVAYVKAQNVELKTEVRTARDAIDAIGRKVDRLADQEAAKARR